jgi:hypothetical protein
MSGPDIVFGESSLRPGLAECVIHYNQERNHQGLADQLIRPETTMFPSEGNRCRRKRLGGLLNYYYREANKPMNLSFWIVRVSRSWSQQSWPPP